MKIHCLYDELVNPQELKQHPKNSNKHPLEQVERLAKILEYQGFRYPIKVSKRSGFIVSGHGRLAAAMFNNYEQVPVQYQDYESDEQELADLTADNAIASWAELDLDKIRLELPELSDDFDLDLLGIEDFKLNSEPVSDAVEKLNEENNQKYILEVQFPNDMEMMEHHDNLISFGYVVKIK
jgi:ParB-like chromosome segregation protein Spo0J